MQSKSERERLVTNTKHKDSWKGKDEMQNTCKSLFFYALLSFTCYRLSPFYLALEELDFKRKPVFYVCCKRGEKNR